MKAHKKPKIKDCRFISSLIIFYSVHCAASINSLLFKQNKIIKIIQSVVLNIYFGCPSQKKKKGQKKNKDNLNKTTAEK